MKGEGKRGEGEGKIDKGKGRGEGKGRERKGRKYGEEREWRGGEGRGCMKRGNYGACRRLLSAVSLPSSSRAH